jgi:hypothetical protein
MSNEHRKTKLKKTKRVLTAVTLLLPFLYLGFIVADRFGVWDRLTGLYLVEQVSQRFDLSYADDASHPVRVGDKTWDPVMKLIFRYSKAHFDESKTPRVVARFQASLSTRTPEQGPVFAEWTAPSTPIVVIYQDWPTNTGKGIPPEQFCIVGTIGDLRDWISKEKDRRKFLVQDIFLGTFGPLLGVLVFILEKTIEA